MRHTVMTLSVASIAALSLVPTGSAMGAPVPVVASENIEVMFTIPEVGAISTAFDPARPLMYVNTLNGISSYDISNPEMPVLEGTLPMPHFENEAMAIGRRADGTTFLLVGVDIYSVTPTDTSGPAHAEPGSAQHLIVVDVTDPMLPEIVSQLSVGSSTHTVQCVTAECLYAYTSGAYNGGTFHLIDLTDLADPKQVAALKNVAGEGHQWDHDDAGVLWSSAFGGVAAYDVTDPAAPKALNSTNAMGTKTPYNDFILHNSYRPSGDAFTQTRDGVTGRLVSGTKETASVFDGNVLLVTEEDYDNPVCGGNAGEGTFSTWYVPYLDNEQFTTDHPQQTRGDRGTIEPLDNWNTEIMDTGTPTPVGALCSAHYFTYHDAGFIAQGWYQQGTRILDVRNPRDIKQVGYFFTGDTETWHAYWVPERDAEGKVTGKDTNIIYTNDVARGIDVLKVTLPTSAPAETAPLRAPILPQWLSGSFASSAPSPRFGYLCRLTGGLQVA